MTTNPAIEMLEQAGAFALVKALGLLVGGGEIRITKTELSRAQLGYSFDMRTDDDTGDVIVRIVEKEAN